MYFNVITEVKIFYSSAIFGSISVGSLYNTKKNDDLERMK